MKIVIVETDQQFEDKKQALLELAFCHYPVTVEVDGKRHVFEWFSDAQKFIENIED